ncbi:MAG: beta-lactamase family protein [Candidatus Saganbacteria bacterium]|nr:beta-lactamase family protein [Candidatus Saganbacteria bacterium]
MKNYKYIVAVILALTAFFFFSSSKPLDKAKAQKLDNLISAAMKKYNAPAMMLGVWKKDKCLYLKAEGLADIKTKRPIEAKNIFRIGSLTKTFTCTVLLQLVDENKIGLDDKLVKYFDWVPNAKNITIRQLLNMTSGLHNYSETEEFGKIFEKNPLKEWPPEQLAKIGVSKKPYFKPGADFHYSNTNTVLLGMIIEKLTKSSLKAQIEQRIINPLNLKHTYFPKSSGFPEKDYIHGYMTENGKLKDWSIMNVSWGWAAGALISNIYDLKNFITVLGRGTLLSPSLQKERIAGGFHPKHKEMKTLRYALGCFTAAGFIGHNGGLPGYVNIAMYNPDKETAILLMMNTQPEGEGTLGLFKRVFDILYPGEKI